MTDSSSSSTLPLPLIGNPSIRNRGSSHWVSEELVAFGCGKDIIIIDSTTLKLVQVCSSQSGDITHVYWLPCARSFTNETTISHKDLISSDTNGEVAIWNALFGEVTHRFVHPENNNRALIDLQLGEGIDHWSRSKAYILYTGHLLVVFDYISCTYQNVSIQIAAPGVEFPLIPVGIFKFCVENGTSNPTQNRLAFVSKFDSSSSTSSSGSTSSNDLLLTFCSGWDYQKENRVVLRKQVLLQSAQRVTGGGGAFLSHSNSLQNLSPPVHQTSSSDTPEKSSRPTSIRRLVSDIIVGTDVSSSSSYQNIPVNANISFHRGIQDAVLVSTDLCVFLVSVHFMTVLHVFPLDKPVSPIVHTIPSKEKSCIVTVHENGAVYLRKYVIVGTHIYSMELETVCSGENPRFSGKRPEVVSCVLHPFEENSILLYFSDGRFLQYGFVNGDKEKVLEPRLLHMNTPSTPFVKGFAGVDSGGGSGDGDGDLSGSSLPGFVDSRPTKKSFIPKPKWVSPTSQLKSMLQSETDTIKLKLKRMTPSLGQISVMKSDGNTLILGTNNGFLIVLQIVEKGHIKMLKKLAVHSSTPVSGIEYVSESCVLSYVNINFSTNPKCELIMVNLKTGACTNLKSEAKHHIQCISISPLKQYFVLAYQSGAAPCELWDLSRSQLIKTLPSKLPAITCVQWREKDNNGDDGTPRGDEVFYLTDYGSFLFTFRVSGSRFAAATCVKLDTNSSMTGIPISLFTRGNLVFRVDSNGTLVIYNTEKKTASPGFHLGKGPLISVIAFGVTNFIAQFTESVELWDFQNLKKIRTLLHGKMTISSITVMNHLMVYIPSGTNSVKFLVMDRTDESSTRHPIIPGRNYTQFLTPKEKCSQLYAFCKDTSSELTDLIQLCKKIGTPDEVRLWCLLNEKLGGSSGGKVEGCGVGVGDEGSNSTPPNRDVGLFSNDAQFKEMLVKLSQCVWTINISKREDVGRLLLLCGETDRAAEVLLDTEPTNKGYVFNGMKASIAVGSANLPEQSKAVLKIIATNLIACGDMDEGLELLCLLGKHSEACKYIESNNEWRKAVLLCKTALPEKSSTETLSRYAQYLLSRKCVIQAALVYVYIGKYERAVEALFGARLRHLSYLLYVFCLRENVEVNLSDHIRLAINLDFARFLFDYGLTNEAISFCESLGNDAKDLKNELEILAS